MAKKVIASTDSVNADGENMEKNTVRKKRGVCCTCCLIALIFLAVVLVASFGVGWIIGDKMTKQYLDMSLGQTFGVMNDLYWTKDKHVITNPYTEEDLNGFYSQIKPNMLLKEDADIDFDAALQSALQQLQGGDGQNEEESEAARKTATEEDGGEGDSDDGSASDGDSDGSSGSSSAMDLFVNMIADVFKRDNIDVERLKNYADDNDEYIFVLRDKQLAAFADRLLKTMLGSDGGIAALEEISKAVSLDKEVSIKQISFRAESQKNEMGEEVITATVADITVWVGLQDAAGQALSYFLDEQGYGWASGLASWLGNVFLPKNLYVTASIPLDGEADAQVKLNDMSDAKRDRTYKLINGIMVLMGQDSERTVQSLLNEFADKLTPYMQSAADSIDFSSSSQGAVKLDLIGTMANMASKGLAEGEQLTKPEFMYMLQALLTSDAQARLESLQPYLYDKWYVDGNGNYSYDPDDKTGFEHVDYVELLIEEIEEKYAVDLGEGEDRSLTKILAMLGISLDGGSGEAGSKDMFDMINAERFNAAIDKNADDIKLRITDRMLAAVLSDQLNEMLLKDGSAFNGLSIGIDALTFLSDADHPERTYAMLAADIDVSGLFDTLGEASVLSKLAANVLPEKILLSITVDVTLSLPAGEQYQATTFMFNDYENTDRVVATLGKLIPSLDLTAMTGDIEKLLRDMLLQLDETVGIQLVPSDGAVVPVKNGELVMTDIFEIISQMVLVDEAGEPIKLNTDLRSVLRAINDSGSDVEVVPAADNYTEFLSEVADMYYLDMQVTPTTTIDDLTAFMQDGEQGFDASKFRVKAADGTLPSGVKYLIYDDRSADELRPCMSAAELGHLISSKMGDGIESYELIGVKTSRDELVIELSVAISDVMPDKVRNLISAEKITVTATVDLDSAENGAYAVRTRINRMDDATYADLLSIINLFGVDLDIETQVAELGKIMYEQMQSIGDGLGGESLMTFTDRGIEFDSFYAFLANKMDLINAAPETVKRALQGMYEISEIDEYLNRDYNYDTTEFIVNRGSNTPMDQAEFAVKAQSGMTDAEFNGYFQGLISSMAANSVEVVQTTVLSAGTNEGIVKTVRDRLNSKLDGSPISLSDDYLAVTFKMVMDEYMSSDKSSSTGFLPDHVYATAVIKYDAAISSFTDVGIVFNDMDSEVYGVLLQLMGLSADAEDDSKVNIKTVTAQAVDGLNMLAKHGTFEFGAASGGAHGTVKYSAHI